VVAVVQVTEADKAQMVRMLLTILVQVEVVVAPVLVQAAVALADQAWSCLDIPTAIQKPAPLDHLQ
jgi:hypothetical protein